MQHSPTPPPRPPTARETAPQPIRDLLQPMVIKAGDAEAQLPGAPDQAVLIDLDAPAVDAASTCRLPPFWRADPGLWFARVEAAFEVGNIRSDNTKFSLAVNSIDFESLSEVKDIVQSPPPTGKYLAFKQALLARFTESPTSQISRMLNQVEFGDKRPSQLLRYLKDIAANRFTEEVLRVKWLNLLPSGLRGLLTLFRTPTLEDLAKMADEVMDASPSFVAAAELEYASTSRNWNFPQASSTGSQDRRSRSPGTARSNTPVSMERLAADFASMQANMSQMSDDINDLRSRSRSPWRSQKSRSRQRSTSPATRSTERTCYYHKRWGAKAEHCRPPCSFRKSNIPEN